MGSNTAQKEYIVCYMDILGYKEFFERNESEVENFLTVFDDAVNTVKSSISIFNKNSKHADIKIFSDNILIYVECKGTTLFDIAEISTMFLTIIPIQMILITKYGLYVRGGITKGKFFSNDDYVFGKSLIDAYELEQKAINPKILIDKSVIKPIENFREKFNNDINDKYNATDFLKMSEDELDSNSPSFTNFVFNSFINNENKEYFINYLDNNILSKIFTDNKSDELYLEMLGIHKIRLIEKLKIYGNYTDIITVDVYDVRKVNERRKVMDKYLWVLNYHNRVCEDNNFQEYKVDYKMDIDKTVHLPIIEVSSNEAI